MQANLAPDVLKEVHRLLYGCNDGESVQQIQIPEPLTKNAAQLNCELQGYQFKAALEQLRTPRVVRIGVIQHAIPLPATAPYAEQRNAAYERVGSLIAVAGRAGCKVLCLQEAWPMPFGFCTREKSWCEFAECAGACQRVFWSKHC